MDYQSVLNEVESWPLDERIRLVEDVWDRLGGEGYEPDLTPELKAELDQRIAEMESNPELGVPWEQAKARVLRRLQQ
jgi:putative addiction module component (TIGR02574 family)